MAKLALTAVGMGLGFMIGGPMGAQIGAMIGSEVGNLLFSPTIKGPRMTDLSVTSSTYGNTIPELYGTMRMSGNVIWSPGIKEHKHTKSGGKGGQKTVTYTYSASYAIAFCRGEVDNITRIWADGKLIAGAAPSTSTSGPVLAESGILNLTKDSKGKFSYRFYKGSPDQLPDSTIIADKGDGNVPAYRDLCYLVFIDMPLDDFANRIPQITAEITRNPTIATPYTPLQSANSDGTFSSTPDGGQWGARGTVDWANNQFYKIVTDSVTGKQYFVHYDMRTMQELFRVEVQPGEGSVAFADPHIQGPFTATPSFNPCFSIGGAFFFANDSLGNSGAAGIWDAGTGAWLGRIGHYSNSGPTNLCPDNTQPFYPEGALIGTWDAQAMWFRILSDNSLTGWNDLVYQCGNLGTKGSIWDPARNPVHLVTFPFGSAYQWWPMRGRENPPTATGLGTSDMLFLNNSYDATTGWDVHLKIVTVMDLALMQTYGGPPYGIGNHPANNEFDIMLPRPIAGIDFSMINCAYDQSDNSIVIWGAYGGNNFNNGSKWCFAKYLISEGVYKWAYKDTDLSPSLAVGGHTAGESVGYPTDIATQSNLDGGTVGWVRTGLLTTNAAIYVADLQTGEITLANIPSPVGNDGAWAMNAWDDTTQSVMGAPTRVFITTNGDGVSLQAIVDDVLTRTGALVPGEDWDSSALAPVIVHGYAISRDSAAKDVLNQLSSAYFFDGYESDNIIKMKLRGGDSVATIQQNHLSWVQDRDNWLRETRTQEVELPMRVTVNYSDTGRDYQAGAQSAKRNTNPLPTMHSHTEGKIDFPIAMSATDAKQIADKTLKMAWAGRWQYNLKMPWEFLKYDPTDVITLVSEKGNSYKVRLSKMVVGVDFTIAMDAISEQPAAYTSSAVAEPGTTIPVQVVATGGPVDLYILNTPLLQDLDDTQGIASVYYATAKSKSPGDFSTAYLYEATDATLSEYDNIDVFTAEPTWGTAQSVLPARFHYGVDSSTVLTVRLMSVDASGNVDTLESCTIDELVAGKNAALVGNEIIQFMTATVQPDGRTYQLTNLLRARRGTNYATSGHVASERFIMLDSATLIRETNAPSQWALTHSFKAVAKEQYPESVQPISVPMQPVDLKPYTPECVKCGDDGTNATLTFERRSRISSELTSGTGDVPYREGQGSLAHFVYNVYANKLLTDTPWVGGTPDFTGNVPIYSGVTFAPLTFNFPLAGVSNFVVEIHEVGFVDGFPKIVQFVRERANDWAMTELY